MKDNTVQATATAEAGSAPKTEAKTETKRRKPQGPRRSAVERLTEQLAAAQAAAAERARTRIEKAKAELEAATKDFNRAQGRKDAAELALRELEAAIAVTSEPTPDAG